MSTRKRTVDEITLEIERVNRALTNGGDHTTLKAELGMLEREHYAALSHHIPQNHLNYTNARDGQRIALLQAEISNINREIAADPESRRRGILQGDRERYVKMLDAHGVRTETAWAAVEKFVESGKLTSGFVHLRPLVGELASAPIDGEPIEFTKIYDGEQAASLLLEALEVHTVLMPVSESRPNLKIDELVPTEARIAQYADFRGAGTLVGPESNPVDAETMQAAADALDRYAPLVEEFKEAAEEDDAADAPAEEPVTDDSEDLPF